MLDDGGESDASEAPSKANVASELSQEVNKNRFIYQKILEKSKVTRFDSYAI